jgi:soluble lytic murein transglycosylase-like protein
MGKKTKKRRRKKKTPRTTKRRVLVILGAAVVLVGVGVWLLVRRGHERKIDEQVAGQGDIISRHAAGSKLPVWLVKAVIRAESGGDPRAVSPKNAHGLMQITPIAEAEVLRRLKAPKGDIYDPDYNVRLGTAYLRMQVDRFDGDLYLALAAYNMGPTRLEKIRKAHPGLSGREIVERHVYPVTARYCKQILQGRGDQPSLP